jgi:transcriptional regulator with XRE-family HTH domain
METGSQAVEAFMTSEENSAFFKRFGKRLAAMRKACGMTQAQVAEILGYSQAQVASFETGRRRIPLSALPPLAKALGVSFDDLLSDTDAPAKRGPTSKIQSQLERLSKLPRGKQKIVSEMLDGLLKQAS